MRVRKGRIYRILYELYAGDDESRIGRATVTCMTTVSFPQHPCYHDDEHDNNDKSDQST